MSNRTTILTTIHKDVFWRSSKSDREQWKNSKPFGRTNRSRGVITIPANKLKWSKFYS